MTVVALIGWFSLRSAESVTGAILPLLLAPLGYQLWLDLIKRRRRLPPRNQPVVMEKTISGTVVSDNDRRLFLKLAGSTGLSLFFMALIGKKSAQAAFFGSMPGPGTISLKDSSGNKIDPAEKHPTDGYNIAQVDDSSDPDYAYYGFTNKDGNWYIQREALTGVETGSYRYFKGSTSFSSNWTGRDGLGYDDFEDIFD